MSLFCAIQRGSRSAALGLAVALAAACNAERGDVLFQAGDYIFNFVVDGSLAGGLPAGSETINDFDVAVVDATVSDAFDRSVPGNSPFYSATGTRFGAGWSFLGFDRNGLSDPRLPAIVESDAVVVPSGTGANRGFVIGDPNEVGSPGFHNPFIDGDIVNLQPNSTYTVAFFRYGLIINGQLDASLIVQGQPVDSPDELVPVDGTPKGDPTVLIVSFPTIVSSQSDANPFVLGHFTTDANGSGFFDVVVRTLTPEGDSILYLTTSGAPPASSFDSSLVARNDDTPTTFPRYNYLVVLEGAATTAAEAATLPHALRAQIAQDFLASTGEPINNAYAPFPAQAYTKAQLLGSPCCAGRASTLTFTFDGLSELTGSVYQVWLFNEETDAFTSPSGDWVATVGPDTVASASGTRTFSSQKTWTHTFRTSDALAGQPVGEFTHVFLSIESAEASTASARQPLWAQYTDMGGSPQDPFDWSFTSPANMSFGTFGSGAPTPWGPSGVGQGGFWGAELGETDRLVVELRNLPIPPRGYYYEAWLVNEGGTEVQAGELTAPFDEGFASLRDVDEDQSLSEHVRSDLIIRAVTRAFEEDLGAGVNFEDFDEYRLVLSPKARAAVRPPTTALGGLTPEPLRARRP